MDWENGEPKIDLLYTKHWEVLFWNARKKGDDLKQFHVDLAATVQRVTEQMIFHILNKLHEKTGLDNLCIAGGVAQNSVVNGKILLNTPFKNLYVPSAGHDAGTSIGSALYLYNHILKKESLQKLKPLILDKNQQKKKLLNVCLKRILITRN